MWLCNVRHDRALMRYVYWRHKRTDTKTLALPSVLPRNQNLALLYVQNDSRFRDGRFFLSFFSFLSLVIDR